MALTTTSRDTVIVLPPVVDAAKLSDADLMAMLGDFGAARRQVDAGAAVLTRELALRSSRDLGHQGLAARNGLNSPEKLVRRLTGVSFSDARQLATAGAVLDAVDSGTSSWLAPVAEAVSAGTLSVAAASAIASGLGDPSEEVSTDDLQGAMTELLAHAATSTPEDTAKAARALRAQLDVSNVADREAHLRSKRSVKWSLQADGTTRLVAILDPESAAIVIDGALVTAMAPRRGGPRFVDAAAHQRASAMSTDSRTNEQLAADILVEIVQLAGRAAGTSIDDASQFGAAGVFGVKSPAVRVHVQAEDLRSGEGFAYFEGQSSPISIQTAERVICESGILPILFEHGHPIDVGRTQRLHSAKQRAAIAAYWNGCAFHGCDAPPQYTEVHHCRAFDGSNTTLINGISLCRFHHMEVHANGWIIQVRSDGTYWLIPPPTVDPRQVPLELRPKSPFRRAS
ncbi:MAG: DUF222 domain-containing protein [Rhodoglobus sp.]